MYTIVTIPVFQEGREKALREQQGAYPIQRASRQQSVVARPRRSFPQPAPDFDYDLEDDDSYYETRVPTSSRRYVAPQQPQVVQRGNRRLVIHPEPPTRKGYHWLVYVGFTMVVMITIWLLVVIGGAWWQGKQDDWTYGKPRTYQTDQNVGHGTAQVPDSHFIAVNLNGIIQVIELPANDSSKAKIYNITTLNNDDGSIPVSLAFRDLNADGKLDMVINIGDPGQQMTVFLLNTGTGFASKL